jgi:prepilin-type N-terminal cleavage/methylation domain-containing protein
MEQVKNQRGFTLIEILVAVSLVALIITAAASLFFYSLRNEEKTRAILEVKQVGDNSLEMMANKIRRAKEITSAICDPSPLPSSSLVIVNNDETTSTFSCSSGRIKLNDDFLTSADLTVDCDSFQFTCFADEGGGPEVVEIDFTLDKISADPLRSFSLDFKTNVSLRTF